MIAPMLVIDQDVEQAVLRTEGLVMVKFWATWCASCRMLAPVVDELATEYAGRVAVVKVNVDENPDDASRYQVWQTPTIIFFRDGQEVKRIVGAGKKAFYIDTLEALLK